MAEPERKIGPTFGAEVTAAGLGGKPFSWNDAGQFFGKENLSPEDQATLDAVYAAHVPRDLTPAEQFAVKTAALDEATIQINYEQENRIRALEGLPPLTLGDFHDKVKTLKPPK